ncbi:MAG: protein-disulfide reductase DsbD family protein [Spirochaetes bacterium]|nr:protein-disulfide reductase DsbD family protein [Spirochaetota bacterium]
MQAELVAPQSSIKPGEPFIVGLRLAANPGWHTYWRNPGDSGLATRIEWDLPEGIRAAPPDWPVPQVFEEQGLTTYGYEGEAMLLIAVTPSTELELGTTVTLRAQVSWLACRVACVPGSVEVSLDLPVRTSAPLEDTRGKRALDAAKARMPGADSAVVFKVGLAKDFVDLRVDGLPVSSGATVQFLPDAGGFIDTARPQTAAIDASGLSLRLARVRAGAEPPDRLQGLLVVSGGAGDRGLVVDAPLPAADGSAEPGLGIVLALIFAFLGGILLNLMPCVLPVLSLKVVSLVRNARSSGRGALAHGLAFSMGVLVSFWLIAGLLLALRAGGHLLGWGFQFQSPGLVAGVAVLFFLVGLNLFGVFELGTIAASAGARVQSRGGWVGSFASGLLATAVATPCTAPFMGSALGYALSRPPVVALAVFTALGLGMSLPYLVLSAAPGLLERVPRPGRWMETLKQAMGFPMMAAVVWMASVLIALSGAASLLSLLAALVASAVGAWVWGRWGGIDRPRSVRLAAAAIALAFVAAGAVMVIRTAETGKAAASPAGGVLAAKPSAEGMWEPWSPERVAELREAGRPVFIDFSAQWCLTCQVNERVALRRGGPVERRLRELGVAALKADWTDRSDRIAAAIAGYGRAGVPLYVLYAPGAGRPVLLPELLTAGIVLDALEAMR